MLLLPLRLDLAPHLVHRLILYFNPRTPVGCDMRYHSITPVRCNFNPRTPVGCAPVQKYSTTVSKFQSTHPSGVRRRTMHCEPRRPYFNPHTPVGCDITHGTQPTRPCYFNPRTPVGCDHPPRMWLARHAISIHAPREGCDGVLHRTGIEC